LRRHQQHRPHRHLSFTIIIADISTDISPISMSLPLVHPAIGGNAQTPKSPCIWMLGHHSGHNPTPSRQRSVIIPIPVWRHLGGIVVAANCAMVCIGPPGNNVMAGILEAFRNGGVGLIAAGHCGLDRNNDLEPARQATAPRREHGMAVRPTVINLIFTQNRILSSGNQ